MVHIHLDDLPAEQSGSCGIWFKSSDIKALIFSVACNGDQTVAGATGRRNAAVIE